ncbi:MAG: hypothetical protein KDC39_03910 [Actinobacteria bacterium]|nr:hypothetical protein [Actinomycetota bacterium]
MNRRTAIIAVSSAAALTLLAACSSSSQEETTSPTPTSGTELTVTVDTHEGRVDTWTVSCDPDEGNHPDPAAACNFLRTAAQWNHDPFAPVPADQVCGQIYGGPQTATVTGTWDGNPVDAQFNLTNSCEIGRWSSAIPLLVVSVPSQSPPATSKSPKKSS